MEGQRSVEEECMACLWTEKNTNILLHNPTITCLYQTHFYAHKYIPYFLNLIFLSAVSVPRLVVGELTVGS